MGVDTLEVSHLDQQLAERGILARHRVAEVGVGDDGQQVVAHTVVAADLLVEQGVHCLLP